MIFLAKHIEGLPFAAINAALSLRLEHGKVHISRQTLRHIYERHPNDYAICVSAVEGIIKNPEFIGQAPHHRENFEVISQVNDVNILIAISSIPDARGDYPIMSSYIIPEGTFQRSLRKGYIQRYQ